MSKPIEDQVRCLSDCVRALSLIGASVQLRSRHDVDRDIREQIEIGSRLVLNQDIDTLDDHRASALLRVIEMSFAEAVELFQHPDRSGGWKVEDATLLQTQGEASRQAFRRILSLAETRPLLQETLKGHFLDVGTGVGGIALEAAKTCPSITVDGIDIWDPALVLAEQNIAASPYADRINVTRRNVSELEPGRRYTLVWLPTMFMKRPVLERALDRITSASLGGSYLVMSLYTRPRDPIVAALSALRTLRSGGELLDSSEAQDMLCLRGYVDVESDVTPLATFAFGRLHEAESHIAAC